MKKKVDTTHTVSLDYWSDFANVLVNYSNLKSNGKILDVGTGTGTCLTAAVDKLEGNCQLVGIDHNSSRISQARKKFKDINVENVKFHTMKASNLKFEENNFDNVLCGFIGFTDSFDFEKNQVINNAKMKEIFRVLKPRGEAAFSTWAYQQDIEVARTLLQQYLRDKGLKPKNEIDELHISYSKESINGFKLMMEDAGFVNIRIFAKDFTIIYKSIEEWWDIMEFAAWIITYALNHDPVELKNLKNYCLPQGIESFKNGDSYNFQKSVIFAFGSK
jgi:ubiquinone/menaquinone biosynthesis C-methylase UbiE